MSDTNTALVLIVEDEPAQMEMLSYNVTKDGYRVIKAYDGEEAILLVKEEQPDLVLLDWMLPGLSGIEVCRQLKRDRNFAQMPILMLTARGEESDKVRGLDTGADDYIVKPYSVVELMARVRALIRRSNPAQAGHTIVHGDITLNTEQHKVTRNGSMISLGPTEFRVLSLFLSRPGRVWSRDQLLERCWTNDLDIDLRTVDVVVGRLRKALKQPGKQDPIRTVRSAGYSVDLETG